MRRSIDDRKTLARLRLPLLALVGFVAGLVLFGPGDRWSRTSDKVLATSIESRSLDWWRDAGFVEMVPPLRPPSSLQGDDAITVWLALPAGGRIDAVDLAAQRRAALSYPSGTRSDRVELLPGRDGRPVVVDVRGTTFLADGAEEFHVLRAEGSRLRGFRWRRGDAQAQDLATRSLSAMLEQGGDDDREVRRLADLNRCAFCHLHDKPPSTRPQEGGRPNRASDHGGLFAVQVVLEDEAPLERERPREMNADDPHMTFFCRHGDERAPAVVSTDAPRASVACADGSTPWAKLDLAAALLAGDDRAKRVCRSREFLRAHMTPAAARVFRGAFEACGPTSP